MAMILALLPLLACRPKAPDTGPAVDSRDSGPADTQHSGLDSPGESADSEPKHSDSAPPDSPAETGDSGSSAPPGSGAVVYALGDVGQKIIHDVAELVHFQVATGDVDGDGRSDLLVGASEDESSAGVVHALGPGLAAAGTLADDDYRYLGHESATPDFAGPVQALGDQDGDGAADLLIGAWNLQDADHQDGGAYVVTAVLGSRVDLRSQASAVLWGTVVGDEFVSGGWGTFVLAPGDVDGDSLADMVVMSNYWDPGLALVHGPVGGDTELEDAALRYTKSDHSGPASATMAGDVDGDGVPEVLVGGAGSYSSPYLFSLAGSGDLTFSDALATWNQVDWEGCAIALLGADIDGDGYSDVMLGTNAEHDVESSLARIWYGPVSGTLNCDSFDAEVRDIAGETGESGSAGDIDGDGRADFAFAGCSAEDCGVSDDGFVTVYLGPLAGSVDAAEADYTFTANTDDELDTVDLTGDFDADGLNDLVIVAAGDDDAGEDAGAIWIVYGNRI